jgi:hypothetical protein
MASDLISRKALIAEYDRVHIGAPGGARKLMEDAPTVDAVEVVHGRWQYWAGGLAQCSVCGYEYTDYLECKNYCGNCGAKMDGGNEDG